MKRQRSISRGALSRLFTAAAEAWKRQQYQESIDLLERGSRLDPANATLQLDLGRAYGMRYDYPAAERCFEKALRVAPQKMEALVAIAQRWREVGQPESAKAMLEQAAQEPGVPAEALVALAEIHERQGRLAEATALVERAAHADRTIPAAHLARARLHRLTGELEKAEAIVREQAKADLPPWIRAQAWYELGTGLDRQQRFDEAMAAFLEAKAVLRPLAANAMAILQGIQARVQEMEQTISAEILKGWVQAGAALEPKYSLGVLCGHPRSGTTLLEQVLDAHPDVVTAEETHILHDEAYLPLSRGFSTETSLLSVLESAPASELQRSRQNYFRYTELFLGKKLAGRVLIDKNPAFNVLIPAVVRIFPEAKFLVALRDPRDVCLSCFMQPLSINPVSSAYLSLEGTVAQYASAMGFWKVMLPRMANPWLELRYEEMVSDLDASARRVLEFLGVGWDERVLRFHEHARTKLVRSPTYAEVTRPVFKTAVGRWVHYQKYLEPWLGRLEPFLKHYGYE